ncbi:hypothetical protein M2149_000810 [Lachnospiraceae bacterium PFB1-21]
MSDFKQFLRRVHRKLRGIRCADCKHYDGRYGDDNCFACLVDIRSSEYEQRKG